MTAREITIDQLVGRTVRDAEGRSIGRIEELRAEIELHEHGVDYVVVEYHVGTYGALDRLAGSRFARHLMRVLGRAAGHRRHVIPWQRMDLRDPARPMLTGPASEPATTAR